MESLVAIESQYRSLAARINAPDALICFSTRRRDDGNAHVESDDCGYCYVVTERGQEYERRATRDVDELLYWLVCDIVFQMASTQAAGQANYRYALFQHELRLLATLNEKWMQRKKKEIDEILVKHPYLDRG